ncbi:MAG: alpha/beta hydrolase [Candidatus Latescibacteria bacterium]|nr:alpha/beta hydrolase [Candidatus Latescibacterota bacterium]
MKGIEVLLQHGWAWDAGGWAALEATAPAGVVTRVADRGYFGTPSSPGDGAPVLVAHSFGLHLLEPRWVAGARLVVVLGGFAAFHPEGAAGRRSRRVVGRMRQGLEGEPVALLADFRARCFAPEAGEYPLRPEADLPLLAADLERLDTQTPDLAALAAVPRVLLLHGEQDQIVPVERAQDLQRRLPNSHLERVAGAGHALPLTRAAACWAAIAAAWTELEP